MRTLMLTSMALFAASMCSANAGPCCVEIDGLTKAFASKDAGSGSTIGAGSQAQAPSGSPRQEHPPTAVMGQETQGKAASAEDVRRQNQGQPTAAQQGTVGTSARTDKASEASAALSRP
jgi:hypothetical protein